MGTLIKAILEFIYGVLKESYDTPTTASEVEPNRNDADRFSDWLRDREEGGSGELRQECLPSGSEPEGEDLHQERKRGMGVE